jgi:catechol 2,3-dioxygenase-like lactoylglutathione lyase family enzyme
MPVTARTHHVSLSVADLDAMERWYGAAFGLREVVERVELPEPAVRTVLLRAPSGLRIELIERPGSIPDPFSDPLEAALRQGFGHWALEIDDLEQAVAELTSVGAEIVWPPADAVQPGGRFAYVRDPEGNLLELVQMPSGA